MKKLSRNEFIQVASRMLAFTGLAAVLGPIIAYFFPAKLEEMPTEPVRVAAEDDLALGESKTVRFGRYPALIVNLPGGLRAYSAVCTHFACVVKWDAALGQIVCPCHDGFFDPEDGHVIAGPPPTALMALKVEILDGDIYVGGEQ